MIKKLVNNKLWNLLKKITPLRNFVHKCVEWKAKIVKRKGIFIYNSFILPKLLRKVREKDVVDVGFIAWNIAIWKYHTLYVEMSKNPRFNPFLILTPTEGKDEHTQNEEIRILKEICEKRGYKYYPEIQLKDFNYDSKLEADILFYPQPYFEEKLLPEYKKYIFCHTHYGFFTATNNPVFENTFLQNITWKIFETNQFAIKQQKKVTINRARNRILTGYLFGEELMSVTDKDPWKELSGNKKRIIWAPHFSLGVGKWFDVSTFLDYYEFMFTLAEEYSDKIQIAFKPHPYLYSKLCQKEFWGPEKTEAYYQKWQSLQNGQYVEGLYTDLFATSDAIIHDCGSFKVEYLYTQKPGLYLVRKDGALPNTDKVGSDAFDCYYKGYNCEDIRNFVINVVLNGDDTLVNKRKEFYNTYLLPPNGKTAAQNAMEAIEKGLWGKK